MATADEFRSSADQLDADATAMLDSFNPVNAAWRDGVVTGGRLRLTIERAVDATHANVMTVVADLHQMAAECRRRAAICDLYTAEMSAYHAACRSYERVVAARRGGSPNSSTDLSCPPRRPTRPALWVDEG